MTLLAGAGPVHHRAVLVDRSAELAELDDLVAAIAAGAGGRLLVVGEPGVGRTTLLDVLQRRAARRGLGVVRVTAVPGEVGLAGSLLEDLVRMVGRVDAEPQPVPDPTIDRDRGLLDLLESLAHHGPTLVILDDAQFADLLSLRTLATATGRVGPAAVGVVAASTPVPGVERVFAGWPRLHLWPLDRGSAVEMLRAALAPSASPVLGEIAEALHRLPLGLVHAREVLSPEHVAGRAPLPDPMPVCGAVAGAWAPYLDSLSANARAALVGLAVVGEWQQLIGGAAEDVEAGLDEARAAGLLDSHSGAWRFRFPILREVVLARGPGRDVRAAHRRAADLARGLDIPEAIVVEHLVRSTGSQDADTAREVAGQAERAETADHVETAARAWAVAARLSPMREDRIAFARSAVRTASTVGLPLDRELLRWLGDARLAPPERAQVEALRAEHLIDSDLRATSASLWSLIEHTVDVDPGATLMPLFDVAGVSWFLGDTASGLRAAGLLADLQAQGVRDLDDQLPEWAGTALLAAGLFQAGDVARAMALRRSAIESARSVDPWIEDFGRLLVITAIDDILLDPSPEAAERLRVHAQRGACSPEDPCDLGISAWRAWAMGSWSEARELIDRGRPRASASGGTAPWLGMTALRVQLAALTGDEEALQSEAPRLRELATRYGDRRRMAVLDRSLGLRALVRGNLAEAISWLSAAADVGFLGRGLRDAVLPARVDLIEALVRSDDLAEAAGRHAQLHGLLAAMDDPLARALDERAAGLITGAEDAESHYRAALLAHAESGEPFEWARTELLLGELLRRRRRRGDARVVLHSAVHRFEALGAAPWWARAREELRATGGTMADRASAGGRGSPGATLQALTPQERAVAQLASSGMSNAEVADTLVLSRRTVEYHLGNVYRKLGVHGRGALARALDVEPQAAGRPRARS